MNNRSTKNKCRAITVNVTIEEVVYVTVTAIYDESDKVVVSKLVYCIGYVSNKFQTKTD